MKKSILLCALATLICSGSNVAALTDNQAQAAFQTADSDASGDLSKAEFQGFIIAIANMGHAEAARAVRFGAVGFRVAFRRADNDRNGKVTLQELQAIR